MTIDDQVWETTHYNEIKRPVWLSDEYLTQTIARLESIGSGKKQYFLLNFAQENPFAELCQEVAEYFGIPGNQRLGNRLVDKVGDVLSDAARALKLRTIELQDHDYYMTLSDILQEHGEIPLLLVRHAELAKPEYIDWIMMQKKRGNIGLIYCSGDKRELFKRFGDHYRKLATRFSADFMDFD